MNGDGVKVVIFYYFVAARAKFSRFFISAAGGRYTKLEHRISDCFDFRLGSPAEMAYVCTSSERGYEEFSLHVVTPTEVGRIA